MGKLFSDILFSKYFSRFFLIAMPISSSGVSSAANELFCFSFKVALLPDSHDARIALEFESPSILGKIISPITMSSSAKPSSIGGKICEYSI